MVSQTNQEQSIGCVWWGRYHPIPSVTQAISAVSTHGYNPLLTEFHHTIRRLWELRGKAGFRSTREQARCLARAHTANTCYLRISGGEDRAEAWRAHTQLSTTCPGPVSSPVL